MADKKISVIIPIYNAERYLERCLDSLVEQVYSNIEIICVNDGSTDESGVICDRYSQNDPRFKVVHIKNSGVSCARNTGLSLIKGEWFCFVDSDDWVEPTYLVRLSQLMTEYECDVAVCGINKVSKNLIKREKRDDTEDIFVFKSAEECIQNFICDTYSMQGLVTNKLFRTNKFREIAFSDEIKVNEDCVYVYEVMQRCNCVCMTTKPLYNRVIRADSTCHRRPEVADFAAADVFGGLYAKTLNMNNHDISRTLQRNYVNSVTRILFWADYKQNHLDVVTARNKCISWRKSVWSFMDLKSKIRYILAIYIVFFMKFNNIDL